MALIGRSFVVLFAFLIASFAAAIVMAAGMLLPYDWQNLSFDGIHRGMFTMVVGFGFFFISALALLPAVVIIAAAETFRLRSALFYAAAGGLEGVLLFYQRGFAAGMANDPLMIRIAEIMAASGIVGGLLYWAMAGRNAGKWNERRTPAAPPPA
jgi:hypothetical protein